MPKRPNIHRLIELQKLLLEFRAVKRAIPVPGHPGVWENDAEHSYALAVAAWFLVQYFPHLDRDEVIRLSLVHDLVEIYAGDTFAYGEKVLLESKKDREQAAVNRLKTQWHDFPALIENIETYEGLETKEAKFVYALDKIMPPLMVYLDDGNAWKYHNITIDKFRAEKEHKVVVSPEINDYYKELYRLLQENLHLFSTEDSKP